MQEEPAREQDHATAPEAPAPSSSLLDELGRLAGAVRRLFGAQLQLLAAELALLQALLLAGAIGLFRRCMHWMSLPATRHEWGAMMRETLHRAEREVDGESAGERKP